MVDHYDKRIAGAIRSQVGPMIHCRTYIRSDERQHIYIIEQGGSFYIIENAELWELPMIDGVDAVYAFYPTVFGGESHASLADAELHVRQLYSWVAAEDE